MKIRNYKTLLENLERVICDVTSKSLVYRYEKIENHSYIGKGVSRLTDVIEIKRFTDNKVIYITIATDSVYLWIDTGMYFDVKGFVSFCLYTSKESIYAAIVKKLTEYEMI